MAAALHGKLLVQLTTGSPRDAKEMAAAAERLQATYLDGAIQVAPEQMGLPDTTILVSGRQAVYDEARALLALLGGNVVYLGNDVSAAATMDLATLSYVYGAVAGFFQGAVLTRAEGLDVRAYAAIVEAMTPSFTAFLRHEAEIIVQGSFEISQSPLSISVDATARIEQAMRDKGLRTDLPALLARWLRQAQEAGYGNQELAAVTKLLTHEPTVA